MTQDITPTVETKYPPIPDDLRIVFWSLGDANKDGIINITDLNYVASKIGTSDADADFNGDGTVNIKDFAICARNQGLTIDQYWQNTYDREQMQDKLAVSTGIPNLPWYVDWILPILQQQKTNLEAYAYWQQPLMQELVSFCKSQANLASDLVDTTVEGQKKLMDYYVDTLNEHMNEVFGGNMANLPQPIQDIESFLRENYDKDIAGFADAIQPSIYLSGDGSDVQIFNMANTMKDEVSNRLRVTTMVKNVFGMIGIDKVFDTESWVNLTLQLSGAAEIPTLVQSFAAKKVLTAGLDRYYNTQWTPYIPDVSTWIHLYREQHITRDDFTREMARCGYAFQYADLMVQATRTPPSIIDSLTAWRRGLITDADLNRLFDINGLDPEWSRIFEVRQYNDVSLGEVKAMYELGLADDQKVFDTAKRAGYDFNDATAITASVIQANVRRLKARYIYTLVMANSYGVASDADVDAGVNLCGFVPLVAEWIKRVGALKKLILNRAKPTKDTEKLLSLGDLKAAYFNDLITEDKLRTELLTRGYSLDDVNILIWTINKRRTMELAGGKMLSLSVVEYLNAWRYGVITEETLKNKLVARGLPVDEIQFLIITKQKQWKVTPTRA